MSPHRTSISLSVCVGLALTLKRERHGTARHGTARHGRREEKYEKELSKLLDQQSDEVKNIMRAPWNMGSREEKVAVCNTKYQSLMEEMRQRQEQDATKMEVRTSLSTSPHAWTGRSRKRIEITHTSLSVGFPHRTAGLNLSPARLDGTAELHAKMTHAGWRLGLLVSYRGRTRTPLYCIRPAGAETAAGTEGRAGSGLGWLCSRRLWASLGRRRRRWRCR